MHKQMFVRAGALALIAVLGTGGAYALAAVGGSTSTTAGWQMVDAPNSRMLYNRGSTPTLVNDTIPVVSDGLSNRVSGWKTLDLSTVGVPASATAVQIAVKMVATKGPSQGTLALWLHGRKPGTVCCLGPTGKEGYPVDYQANGGTRNPEGMLGHATLFVGYDGVREFSNYTVPVRDGKIEVSWGYRIVPGDAVAVAVYVNGWTESESAAAPAPPTTTTTTTACG